MLGIVIKSTGKSYWVRTSSGQVKECKVKGKFRLQGIRSTNPVAVGDRVQIEETGSSPLCFITQIEERRNYIIRKASNLSKQTHILAANLDLALLVVTVAQPHTTTTFIDRFLASAEAYNVPAALVFNKIDILSDQEQQQMEQLAQVYQRMDYTVAKISALTNVGIQPLRNLLKDKLTLLCGHSGVGKSTLLNLLVPQAHAKTAQISPTHLTGTHTTTRSTLYDLPFGGALIDIPGIKGFGTFNIQSNEVTLYFRDIFNLSRKCRFRGCTHTHEPGCAVIKALQTNPPQLAASRYNSYLSILDDQNQTKYRNPDHPHAT